jgi:hypothetical protein
MFDRFESSFTTLQQTSAQAGTTFDWPEMEKTLNSHNSGTTHATTILRAALESWFHAKFNLGIQVLAATSHIPISWVNWTFNPYLTYLTSLFTVNKGPLSPHLVKIIWVKSSKFSLKYG